MSIIINRDTILELSHKATFNGISTLEVIELITTYLEEKNKPSASIPQFIQFIQSMGMLEVVFGKVLEEYQKKVHICKIINAEGKIIAIY